MKLDLRKIYRFDPVPRADDGSLPKGGNVYYECGDCKAIVASVSHIKAACECGNVSGGGGAIEIREPARVNPLRGTLK